MMMQRKNVENKTTIADNKKISNVICLAQKDALVLKARKPNNRDKLMKVAILGGKTLEVD